MAGNVISTIKSFMKLCLAENDRRMARYDARLVRPLAMPRLIKAAMPFLRFAG